MYMLEGNGRSKVHWGEVNSRELSTDAECSAKEAGGYNLCPAEPLVGAPGLILNKWHGSSFTLKVIK